MKYNNKVQTAREKYLQGLPLSEEEQAYINKDFSGPDYKFYKSDTESIMLPEQYSAESTYRSIEKEVETSPRRYVMRLVSSAVAIAILVLISTIVYNNMSQPEMHIITTALGEKKTVLLPDGSTVVLNSMSSLAYVDGMKGQTRDVELIGEAYFDVMKNKEKPFIVKVNDLNIKVLGTKFNVDAYENESNITTSLFEGAVSVGVSDGSFELMSPGDETTYEKANKKLVKTQPEKIENKTAWQKNLLVFDNEKFENILKSLSREHDVIFISENATLNSLRITAQFSSSISVDQALTILGESAEFKFRHEGNQYIIVAK